MTRLPEAPLRRLTCRKCGQPFEERTNYPEAYTLCYPCDIARSKEIAYSSVLIEDRERIRILENRLEAAQLHLQAAKNVIEAARQLYRHCRPCECGGCERGWEPARIFDELQMGFQL